MYTGPAIVLRPSTCLINSEYWWRTSSERYTGPFISVGALTLGGTILKNEVCKHKWFMCCRGHCSVIVITTFLYKKNLNGIKSYKKIFLYEGSYSCHRLAEITYELCQ